eukprot:GHVL01036918.1.p1 GENE.GHVL01036918.1~~GHVL01036918.1.p1  ORF type:complete len:660 (+),score=179.51 GHVL01036918.1:99-2078(+)
MYTNGFRNLSDAEREQKKKNLIIVIVTVLSRHEGHFEYYQGYHDICAVFLEVMEDVNIAIHLIERFSIYYISDLLSASFDESVIPLLDISRLILEICSKEKINFSKYLYIYNAICIPWLLTFFSHSIKKFEDICIIYDNILYNKPIYILYIIACIIDEYKYNTQEEWLKFLHNKIDYIKNINNIIKKTNIWYIYLSTNKLIDICIYRRYNMNIINTLGGQSSYFGYIILYIGKILCDIGHLTPPGCPKGGRFVNFLKNKKNISIEKQIRLYSSKAKRAEDAEFRNYRNIALTAGALLVNGALLYRYFSMRSEKIDKVFEEEDKCLEDILPMTDEIFERSDNLAIIILSGPSDFVKYRNELKQLIQNNFGFNLKFYYIFQENNEKSIIFYKGQRKLKISLKNDKYPINDIKKFFIPKNQKIEEKLDSSEEDFVVPITHDTFKEEVLNKASASSPILVQYFEGDCLLCYLMRPFMNSLVTTLKELNIPLTIRKLDIDLNDFPPGAPVARGTPTFAFFNGKPEGEVWNEFKAADLIDRIIKEFNVKDRRLSELKDDCDFYLPIRLSGLFTRAAISIDLEELSNLVNFGPESILSEKNKDELHDRLQELLTQDLGNTDNLKESTFCNFEKENSLTADCIYHGMELANRLIEEEKEKDNDILID